MIEAHLSQMSLTSKVILMQLPHHFSKYHEDLSFLLFFYCFFFFLFLNYNYCFNILQWTENLNKYYEHSALLHCSWINMKKHYSPSLFF